MTDGAALPLALSDLVAAMADGGLLTGTITAGHAFGGDLEAVSVPSGAGPGPPRAAGRRLIVVGMGPGVVGSGIAAGHDGGGGGVDPRHGRRRLGGQPGRDAAHVRRATLRPRHQGLSHHTTHVPRRSCGTPVLVAVAGGATSPVGGAGAPRGRATAEPPDIGDAAGRGRAARHHDGPGADEDELFFRAAAAAGHLAASLVVRR